MLTVNNLACFRGDNLLFSKLNISISDSDIVHLSGSNGCGKTTLMRTICGLYHPHEGTVSWNDKNISKERSAYNSKLLYIGHANGLKADLTPIENLSIFCSLEGQTIKKPAIQEILVNLGLGLQASLPVRVLSQGQQRRVALARLFLTNTHFWVLDEPFTALDRDAVEFLTSTIKKHAKNGGMVVLTTHQSVSLPQSTILDLSNFCSNSHKNKSNPTNV